jgi:putative DNA methylase
MPLEKVAEESSRRKQKAPKGFPTAIHKWWSPKPISTAKAIAFCQLVDDPSAVPELFPTKASQDEERRRLFDLIERLSLWDNHQDDRIRRDALHEITKSWERACADNADHPEAESLFNPKEIPTGIDPFAGSGAIPVSFQWLGIKSCASDINPVSVLINKGLCEYPAKILDPNSLTKRSLDSESSLFKGVSPRVLAELVQLCGERIYFSLLEKIGSYFLGPGITQVPKQDPLRYLPTAWIWVRTVPSPNPSFQGSEVPLSASFVLSNKAGREVYAVPFYEDGNLMFTIKHGKSAEYERAKKGTSSNKKATFICPLSGDVVSYQYIREMGLKGLMGARPVAVVVPGQKTRSFLAIDAKDIAQPDSPSMLWRPEIEFPNNPRNFATSNFGMKRFGDIFTDRQLLALNGFSDAIKTLHATIISEGLPGIRADNSAGKRLLADAVCTYLTFALDRMVYYGNTLCGWLPKDSAVRDCMPLQALGMAWDYAEANPFGKSSGGFLSCLSSVVECIKNLVPSRECSAIYTAAQDLNLPSSRYIVSTDPPYYDNIVYGDLADIFYGWMRRTLSGVHPELFETISSPKNKEIIKSVYRHGEDADNFFFAQMTAALYSLKRISHPAYPLTLYYAYKQDSDSEGVTGWSSFLSAIIEAGFTISATVPARSENAGRLAASGNNSLTSSVVLVCRAGEKKYAALTKSEFKRKLRGKIREDIGTWEAASLNPIDISQLAIGAGMKVFSSAEKILMPDDSPVTVEEALNLISECLTEYWSEEGDSVADQASEFLLAVLRSFGFDEADFGDIERLALARNISTKRLSSYGVIEIVSGKARILRRSELKRGWVPAQDRLICAWEVMQYIIIALEEGGESAAARLMGEVKSLNGGSLLVEQAKSVAYAVYVIAEQRGLRSESSSCNALIVSWPEIEKLSAFSASPVQPTLL